MAQYDRFHREIPDKTPVAMPVGYERPEPLESMIARMIRVESLKAQTEGKETFEESDDFDCDDEDIKFTSEHQFTNLQEEELDNPTPKPHTRKRRASDQSGTPAPSPVPHGTKETPPESPSPSSPATGNQTSQTAQPVGQRSTAP